MSTLIVVDCEAPFGVGAPSVGDMTDFGAVDVNRSVKGARRRSTGKTVRRIRSPGSVSGSNSGARSCSYRTIPRKTSSGSTSTSGATSA